MGFDFGGLALAINGYTDQQQVQRDQAYAEQARDQQRAQWQREADVRQANQAIPTTRTTTQDMSAGMPQVDDDGNAMPTANKKVTTQVPQEDVIRQMAQNALTRAGNVNDWYTLTQHADTLAAQRSARQYQDLLAAAPGMSTAQLAAQSAQIFNSSGMPFQVSAVQPAADGSDGVTVQVTNNQTGTVTPRTYTNKDEFLKGIQALADPNTAAAVAAETRKAQLEILKEQSKPTAIAPGGALGMRNPSTGKIDVVAANNNGYVPTGQFDSNGNPIMVKASERLGPDGQPIGGGGGAGGKGKTIDEAGKLIDTALKSSDDPTKAPIAHKIKDQVAASNPSLGAGELSAIAVDAVTNPATVQPTFDLQTGQLVNAYSNPKVTAKPIVLGPASQNFAEAAKSSPDGMKALRAQAQQMIQGQPPALQKAIIAGAQDPAQAQATVAQIQGSQLSDPQKQQAITAYMNKVNAYKTLVMQGKGLVDTVRDALTPGAAPAGAAAGSAAPAPTLGAPVGGLAAATSYAPGSPAARAADARARVQQASAQAQATRQAASANDQQMLSQQFTRDLQSLSPPEVARKYDSLRASLAPQDLQRLNDLISRL